MAAGIRKVKLGKRMMPGNSVKQRIQDFGTEKTSTVHGYWDVCDVCRSWTPASGLGTARLEWWLRMDLCREWGSGVGLEVPRDVQAGLHTSVWEGQEG